MAIPSITNTIQDGGLGVVTPATSIGHIYGVCSSGPQNVPTTISSVKNLYATFGISGPLIDACTMILQLGGSSLVVTRTLDGTAAIMGSITKNGTGPTISNNSSVPLNSFNVILTITKGGTLGISKYKYSLDGGRSQSPEIETIASATIANTGIALTMAAGTYVLGDTYTFTTTAAEPTPGNLTTFFTAAKQSLLRWDWFGFAGEPQDGDNGAALAAIVETNINDYALNRDKYYGAIQNAGNDSAAQVLTDYLAFTSLRQSICFGTFDAPAPTGTLGRDFCTHPTSTAAMVRAAGNLMSTDLMQTSGPGSVGAIPGVLSISQDEYLNNAGLDDAKISSMRTHAQAQGFFLTNVWIRSPAGSDFQYWQHRRIMDEACKVVSLQHFRLLGQPVEVNNGGTISEPDAQRIERIVQAALDETIGSSIRGQGPRNVVGRQGHVSDQVYQVDRTNNVLATSTIEAEVQLRPFGYPKFISTTLTFTAQIAT